VRTQRADARPHRFERDVDVGGDRSRRFERDEVGHGPRRRSAAEGAVLEIAMRRRMVVMLVFMMRRHATRIGRAQFQQERRAVRGHEAQRDI